jgi:hypothetical protein
VDLSDGGSISGAQSATLTLTGISPADAGTYSVVVTNTVGTATSADAILTVTQPLPLRIDSISLMPGGQIRLQISGAPGHYSAEASSNLADWAEFTNLTATNTTFQVFDPETNLTQRFYRMRMTP